MTRTSDELVAAALQAHKDADAAAARAREEHEVAERHARQHEAAEEFKRLFDCEPTGIDDVGIVFRDIHFWWSHECNGLRYAKPCSNCGQPVFEFSNVIYERDALEALGAILEDPIAHRHDDCEHAPTREKPATKQVPFDQPMCTKKERALLDAFEEALSEGL